MSHIFDVDPWTWLQFLHFRDFVHASFSDPHDKSIYTFIFAINNRLGENDSVVCMASAVGDPVFLGHGSRTVDDKLFSSFVIGGCCLHLWCVVAVSKFCEAETTHDVQ